MLVHYVEMRDRHTDSQTTDQTATDPPTHRSTLPNQTSEPTHALTSHFTPLAALEGRGRPDPVTVLLAQALQLVLLDARQQQVHHRDSEPHSRVAPPLAPPQCANAHDGRVQPVLLDLAGV